MNHVPLFEGRYLKLTPVDPEKDAQSIAAWTYELDIAAHMREENPARPMAVFEVKKLYERWQKESEESGRKFLFTIRLSSAADEDNRIIGMLRISDVEWVHGAAYLDLIMGDPQDWQLYASEALELALRYAFDEMSLFRVTAVIAEHNALARALYEQANFTLEVRQRQAVYWDHRTWDKLYFGLLRPEWKMHNLAEAAA